MDILKLVNSGERTFYIYKGGKVVAQWDEKIEPGFDGNFPLEGEGILLHSAIELYRNISIIVNNSENTFSVNGYKLHHIGFGGSHLIKPDIGLDFWVANSW